MIEELYIFKIVKISFIIDTLLEYSEFYDHVILLSLSVAIELILLTNTTLLVLTARLFFHQWNIKLEYRDVFPFF